MQNLHYTKMKFTIKDFFSKGGQIRSWSHLLKKFLLEDFIFCEHSEHYQNHLSELNSNDQSVFKMSFLNALKLKNEDISNVG